MAGLHVAGFWLAVVLDAALLVLVLARAAVLARSLPGAGGVVSGTRDLDAGPRVIAGRPGRFLVDRLILAILATVSATGLIGLALGVAGGWPSDPLHVVYGIVALVALPVARYVGRAGPPHRQALAVAVGALVVLGSLARLGMTGR